MTPQGGSTTMRLPCLCALILAGCGAAESRGLSGELPTRTDSQLSGPLALGPKALAFSQVEIYPPDGTPPPFIALSMPHGVAVDEHFIFTCQPLSGTCLAFDRFLGTQVATFAQP